MKKHLSILITCLMGLHSVLNAQVTTALDFTMNDCSGNMHHLYADLDAGKVVILEYFMVSCSPCIVAGDALEPMINKLKTTCSDKIKFYQFGFTNSYNCTQINNWVSTHGYSSVPMDSGAYQVAYYEGMGMPSIVVAAGSTHKLMYLCNANTASFAVSDTAIIADSIRAFFNCTNSTGIINNSTGINHMDIYPNPVANKLSISLFAPGEGILKLQLFDLNGQKVASLTNELINGGQWTKTFELPFIPPGFYFIRGEFNGENFTRKIAINQD